VLPILWNSDRADSGGHQNVLQGLMADTNRTLELYRESDLHPLNGEGFRRVLQVVQGALAALFGANDAPRINTLQA
jgi:hypothetical protein